MTEHTIMVSVEGNQGELVGALSAKRFGRFPCGSHTVAGKQTDGGGLFGLQKHTYTGTANIYMWETDTLSFN